MEPEQDYYERKEREHEELVECYGYLCIAAAVVTVLMWIGSWVG